MKKLFSVTIVALSILFFTACEKERGLPEACFDTGSAEFKTGSAVRFMNCSKNWDNSNWEITNDVGGVVFTEPTDTLKHLVFSFPAVGNYNVRLTVDQSENSAPSTFTQNITVNTP